MSQLFAMRIIITEILLFCMLHNYTLFVYTFTPSKSIQNANNICTENCNLIALSKLLFDQNIALFFTGISSDIYGDSFIFIHSSNMEERMFYSLIIFLKCGGINVLFIPRIPQMRIIWRAVIGRGPRL